MASAHQVDENSARTPAENFAENGSTQPRSTCRDQFVNTECWKGSRIQSRSKMEVFKWLRSTTFQELQLETVKGFPGLDKRKSMKPRNYLSAPKKFFFSETVVGPRSFDGIPRKRSTPFAVVWNIRTCSECCMVSFAKTCVILLSTKHISK